MADDEDPYLKLAELVERADRNCIDLGLPPYFLSSLIAVDDWTFVIKAHALVEAAMAKAIRKVCFTGGHWSPVNTEALDKIVDNMNFQGRVSKTALVQAYNLLEKSELQFCLALNTVRNTYSHDLHSMAKSIDEIATAENDKNFRQKLALVDIIKLFGDGEISGWKTLIALAVSHVLWSLEFAQTPRRSVLSELLIGDDGG